jgi:hypothetical protein
MGDTNKWENGALFSLFTGFGGSPVAMAFSPLLLFLPYQDHFDLFLWNKLSSKDIGPPHTLLASPTSIWGYLLVFLNFLISPYLASELHHYMCNQSPSLNSLCFE